MAMLSRKCVKSFLIISVLLVAAGINAQNLQADLESVFTEEKLLGIAIQVSVNGNSQNYSFGLRDVDRNLPVNNETQFRIASISKAFTALGVIKLYDNGTLDLDEDISTYLGYQLRNPNFPSTPITLRMVLSHRSGLQDGDGYAPFLNATFSQNPIPNLSELILPGGNFYSNNMWRTEVPGSYFAYSNLNFGLLGTIIEAASNQRFDIFMKTEILEPLGIEGSFNIQDLEDINNLAALYRYQNGNWQPQQDNFEGVLPMPPDLSAYVNGTNGLYFGPQGSLRCTAEDVNKFLNFLKNEGNNGALSISAVTLQEMKAVAWDYNGSNGDNYFGLFNRWGLGLHHANVSPGDGVCIAQEFGTFIGHPGEAYGLISDAFFAKDEEITFSMLINGSQNGYEIGALTSFYTIEESIFSVLCNYFETELSVPKFSSEAFTIFPNPSHDFIQIRNTTESVFSWQLFSIEGKKLSASLKTESEGNIDVSSLQSGVYFLKISARQQHLIKKIIIE